MRGGRSALGSSSAWGRGRPAPSRLWKSSTPNSIIGTRPTRRGWSSGRMGCRPTKGAPTVREWGFARHKVQAASGVSPIAAPIRDTLRAIGRTNDCVLYGATAALVVDATDDEVEQILDRIPSSASRAYGTPFSEPC